MSTFCFALALFFLATFLGIQCKPAPQSKIPDNLPNASRIPEEKSRFERITEEFQKMGNSANSMKSLTFGANTETSGCRQEFNFTLSAIASSEILLHAKLQLLLQTRAQHLPGSNYLVSIHMKLSNDSLTDKSVMRVLQPVKTTHVEFDVTDLLRPLIPTESHGVFVIQVYKLSKTSKSYRKQLECGEELKFVGNDYSRSSIPILVVFTDDQSLKAMNYAAVERAYLEGEINNTEHEVNTVTGHQRRKRQTKFNCGRFPLTISTSAINAEIITGKPFTITSPLSYDAGICGGQCLFYTPRTTVTHALLINLYLRLNGGNTQGYTISQCCVPATYSPLVIHGYEPGASIVRLTLEHMSVNQCTCLDIAN